MATWLNSAFSGLDGGVFAFMNSINCGFLNTFCEIITLLGENGLIYLLGAVVLLLFKKTRKMGICIIGAVGLTFILTTWVIKPIVARARPYTANSDYFTYWLTAGGLEENGYSFVSGHASSVMAFAVALFLVCDKKWSFVGFIFAIIMGFARVYLIAHYTTDIVGGFIIGAISGLIAYYITLLIYHILEKYKDKEFFKFILEFDVRDLKNNERK